MKLRKSDGWSVRDVPHAHAAAMVRRLHYSRGCANTSQLRAALFNPSGCMVGVTMWMPPSPGSAGWAKRHGAQKPVVLSRMVIEDDVPRNGASFLLARACKLLRVRGFDLAITWADELEGHDGHVYVASGWQRAGVSGPASRWVGKDGRMRSRIAGPQRLTVAECEARGWTRIKGKPKPRFLLWLSPS